LIKYIIHLMVFQYKLGNYLPNDQVLQTVLIPLQWKMGTVSCRGVCPEWNLKAYHQQGSTGIILTGKQAHPPEYRSIISLQERTPKPVEHFPSGRISVLSSGRLYRYQPAQ
jgi:hypothetical protein